MYENIEKELDSLLDSEVMKKYLMYASTISSI